jgi:hypothetical protein
LNFTFFFKRNVAYGIEMQVCHGKKTTKRAAKRPLLHSETIERHVRWTDLKQYFSWLYHEVLDLPLNAKLVKLTSIIGGVGVVLEQVVAKVGARTVLSTAIHHITCRALQ